MEPKNQRPEKASGSPSNIQNMAPVIVPSGLKKRPNVVLLVLVVVARAVLLLIVTNAAPLFHVGFYNPDKRDNRSIDVRINVN